jgi:recombination protein RecT
MPERPSESLNRRDQLAALLERKRPALATLSPDPASIDRMLRLAVVAATSSPRLAACEFSSVVSAIGTLVAVGLEAGTPLGHAYLVPYRVKPRDGRRPFYVAQAQLGYRGLLHLARRSGALVSVDARAVFRGDRFECDFGLEPRLVHVPDLVGVNRSDPAALLAVYAIAKLRDGGTQFEVMTLPEIHAIRARSQAGEDGAWSSDFVAMALKSVLRRLARTLPMSSTFAAAAAFDEANAGLAPASARPAFEAEQLLELEMAPGYDEPLDDGDAPDGADAPDDVDRATGEIVPAPATRPSRPPRARVARVTTGAAARGERLATASQALAAAAAAPPPASGPEAAIVLEAAQRARTLSELDEVQDQTRGLAMTNEERRALAAAIEARRLDLVAASGGATGGGGA